MGKLDIYATKLAEFTPNPILLNAPINSTSDDFTFIINRSKRVGYVSSNRGGGKGDDDIYYFIEEEPVEFKCKQIITGEVRDKNTTEIIVGASMILKDADKNEVENIIVGEDGVFKFSVDCETAYTLVGEKDGYTPQTKSLTTSKDADRILKLLVLLGTGDIQTIVEEDIEDEIKPEGLPDVLPVEIVKVRPSTYVVNIEPIYFELNSSYLNKEAKIELQKVVELMNKYPEMIIESGSHTDSRGITGYNNWLSARRATSTVSYIIDHGVDAGRITGKGYGETQLINECSDNVECTEAEHAKNRRTEFVIIKM